MDVFFCSCIAQAFKSSSLVPTRPARHLKLLKLLTTFSGLTLFYISLHFLNNGIPGLEVTCFILASKTTRKTSSKI